MCPLKKDGIGEEWANQFTCLRCSEVHETQRPHTHTHHSTPSGFTEPRFPVIRGFFGGHFLFIFSPKQTYCCGTEKEKKKLPLCVCLLFANCKERSFQKSAKRLAQKKIEMPCCTTSLLVYHFFFLFVICLRLFSQHGLVDVVCLEVALSYSCKRLMHCF